MTIKESVMMVVDKVIGTGRKNPVEVKPFLYSSGITPDGYVCQQCGKKGVKLWREYQTFLDHQTLTCGICALSRAAHGRENGSSRCDFQGPITPDGKVTVYYSSMQNHPGDKTDNIGWLIPAVPTEEGDTYWGYTSVPEDGVKWWKNLPNEMA